MSTTPFKPIIALSMGDPAGIGPEVIVKALRSSELRHAARFVVFGLHESLSLAAKRMGTQPFWYRRQHEDVNDIESGVVVADYDEYALVARVQRKPTAECGHASMRFLNDAIKSVLAGRYHALVTGPIHKTSWQMAGYRYPGHTERLAHACKTRRATMMFVGGRLRVALATVHEPLLEIRNTFTIGRVFQPIDLMASALRDWFGIEVPRIAVAGLNPHAGEDGRFGDEERRIIEPAIVMAREHGVHVDGPFPADTLFHQVLQHRRYDGVVAMYHDQGLIPVKLHAFNQAVNLTLGLPMIRTSPSHGTAFDIVGRNKADDTSIREAIALAIRLASVRQARRHMLTAQLRS